MPKRVSLKGKGADLFFGDFAPPTEDPGLSADGADVTLAPVTDTSLAGLQASMQADQHAGKHAPDVDRDQASAAPRSTTRRPPSEPAQQTQSPAQPEPLTLPAEGLLDAIWGHVAQPAPVTGSFRYTDGELSALTDAVYELSKRHGVKFSKQDVVRLALNAVLWDYQSHGDASLLARFVLRKKHQRGG